MMNATILELAVYLATAIMVLIGLRMLSSPKTALWGNRIAALGMAAKLFAHRLGEHGIPVIEISPGIIASDMANVHKENIDKMIASGRLTTSRWGQPEDVAALVSAFARGDLDYSTGERIEVGGGLGMNRL